MALLCWGMFLMYLFYWQVLFCVFCQVCPVHRDGHVFSFLSCILFTWYIIFIDLCSLNQPCIPEVNPTWSGCMIILMFSWIQHASIFWEFFVSEFVRAIGICFSCVIFVWLRNQVMLALWNEFGSIPLLLFFERVQEELVLVCVGISRQFIIEAIWTCAFPCGKIIDCLFNFLVCYFLFRFSISFWFDLGISLGIYLIFQIT